MRSFWNEIYLYKIEENIKKIRSNTCKKIMAVLKGEAYGLGIEQISEYLEDKVDCFAVSYLYEALKVHSNKDVLIMTPDFKVEDLSGVKENFILTVDDYKTVYKFTNSDRQFRVHIHVNTGMNRFGVNPESLGKFMEDIRSTSDNIHIEGIYTHLNNTANKNYTLQQIRQLKSCVSGHANEALNIHLLNSNGFVKYNEHCDFDNMIRVGGMLYGYDASDKGYKKVYQHKASPINIYKVEKGKYIGYGNLYKTRKNITVGVLDFGYIDKFYCPETIFDTKLFSLLGRIYYRSQYKKSIRYNGRPVKIIGSVNMNYTLIDMEGIPEDAILDVDISAMSADSSVQKKYFYLPTP